MYSPDFTTVILIANSTNGTTSDNDEPYPVYVGYICALIAVVMYGSNFVPVKKYYTGDGMFFQWILCSSILVCGIITQLIIDSPFYPLVMLGGAIWATGNICVVPIFKTIGMGIGFSIWGSTALITGWACGKFGLFGTDKDKFSHITMNYIGVALAFFSVFIFSSVKNEISGTTTDIEVVVSPEDDPLLGEGGKVNSSGDPIKMEEEEEDKDDSTFLDYLSPTRKRIVGTVLSVGSGFMYGVNFMPANYVQDHGHHSNNGLHYVFAQFCGTYLASTVYFIIYCCVMKNKPRVYPRVILPGLISGLMWSIATICWFIANSELGQAVSFPIIAAGPSGIASMFWGAFVFHEIKGKRNLLTLMVAFIVMTTGAIIAGFSH